MQHVSPTADAAALVQFVGVEKVYDSGSPAVADLDLEVRQGEFLTLLGPSGSGKTTTLMMLAGFEAPTRGDILLHGRSLAGKPPHRRNMGVVFQNYALFPHMSVAENLAFPLNVRGIKSAAADRKVADALALVHLEDLGHRRPDQLSGGQKQRVALARALIFEPDIVLMDEPLGALDRQLRERLQNEIKRIQRELGVTVVYVTHDQIEALTLSDRIAVFASGRVQQVDRPEAIYERPATAFVAGFVGENNGIGGTVVARNGKSCDVRIDGGLMVQATPVGDVAAGDQVMTTIRPEYVLSGPGIPDPCNRFTASIDDLIYHGDHSQVRAILPGGATLTIRAPEGLGLSRSDSLQVGWCAERCFAFPASGPGFDPAGESE
ncbi:ABC transporter ATP-binding protein [Sphingosinicella rhizophila]|uniref:ABC transporter ATP-binding protein n=1 Tax=Sphingosinicella rhizophila TaxID=3050082 RepID=A0ABU3QA99_9SPHN|nr:ABC transporter ATP-binding protein [Sphingosinicella sp. GR2756]MDT9600326.1 ABC transporter ATP-binding protein [Sphingosinicella sp. GR2756]